MDFDKSRVYTAVNADELKIGSKVIVANTLCGLKEKVEEDSVRTLTKICEDNCIDRFEVDSIGTYTLAYLVSEPEEKKLKWTDLKVKSEEGFEVYNRETNRRYTVYARLKNTKLPLNHYDIESNFASYEDAFEFMRLLNVEGKYGTLFCLTYERQTDGSYKEVL